MKDGNFGIATTGTTDPADGGLAPLLHEADQTLRRLLAGCAPGNPLQPGLIEMEGTVRRLTRLAARLGAADAIARRRGTPLDLSGVVTDMSRAVDRILGPFIALETHLSPGACAAVERYLAEQVALSLVISAREALPLGGTVALNTHRWHLAAPRHFRVGSLPAGEWAVLEVRDNRLRIDERMLLGFADGAFPRDVDSNLSLASAATIVRSAHGHLVLDATADGTGLAACFPAVAAPRSRLREPATGIASAVLLVLDDAWHRLSTARALRQAGYGVLVAEHGDAALELLDDVAGSCVRLIVCDADARTGDGASLIDIVRARRPDVDLLLGEMPPSDGNGDYSAGSDAFLAAIAARLVPPG